MYYLFAILPKGLNYSSVHARWTKKEIVVRYFWEQRIGILHHLTAYRKLNLLATLDIC